MNPRRSTRGRKPRVGLAFLSLLAAGALLAPAARGAPADVPVGDPTLPNLTPLSPSDVRVGETDGYIGSPPPYSLRFTTRMANRGPAPFDFEPETEGENGPVAAAQCVRWVANRICTERQAAGYYVYHHAHGHYHIEDFARYELRRLGPDGKPDMSPEALAAGGQKISFCVENSEPYDPEPQDIAPNPVYFACEQGTQGISPGWADTYVSSLDGQQIPLAGVQDGIYAIVITFDPTSRFFEGPRDDNTAYTVVEILDEATSVDVVYRPPDTNWFPAL